MLDEFKFVPFHPQNWTYPYMHTHACTHTCVHSGVYCRPLSQSLDDLRWSKQHHGNEIFHLWEEERKKGRDKIWTCLVQRAFWAKANTSTYLVFDFIWLELIRCFLQQQQQQQQKEKDFGWDRMYTWTYPAFELIGLNRLWPYLLCCMVLGFFCGFFCALAKLGRLTSAKSAQNVD